MKLSQFLFNKFKRDKTIYYDEAIIESQIIKLETKLNNAVDKEQMYMQIKESYELLNNLRAIRLIEFVINEMKF